jgi:hypothetical protein
MRLTLNDDERDLLKRLLESDLGDLRFEIADTDSKSMRDDLKRDEATLKAILERLERGGDGDDGAGAIVEAEEVVVIVEEQ